jgi:hypothetical protein
MTEEYDTLKMGDDVMDQVAALAADKRVAKEIEREKKNKAMPRPAGTPDTSTVAWPRLEKRVTEVCPEVEVGPKARLLFRESMTVLAYLELLRKNHLLEDAVCLLAAALPKREAVWWACQCMRSTAGKAPPGEDLACLKAAEAWVKDPSEGNRQAAESADAAAPSRTPAATVALAAAWSGDSPGGPDAPVVAPQDHLSGEAAASAIRLAALSPDDDSLVAEPEPLTRQAEQLLARFVTEGLEVAKGIRRWK